MPAHANPYSSKEHGHRFRQGILVSIIAITLALLVGFYYTSHIMGEYSVYAPNTGGNASIDTPVSPSSDHTRTGDPELTDITPTRLHADIPVTFYI